MKAKRIVIPIVVAAVAAAAVIATVAVKSKNGEAENRFQLGEVTKGSIENSVSSTGTIEAIGTVEIGTQVSGTIAKIYVDFNDHVRAGQLLAVLDTIPLKASVLDAQASVKRAEAQLQKARSDYDRNKPLYEKKLVSEADFVTLETNVPAQEAALQSAKATLERAQFNYENAFIRAPISGTVIERTVEEGQTVAASFNTPKLFMIAEDLSRIEIHAQVDESDIGEIKTGQNARFEVPAYPDRKFRGTVRQIRLQPEVVQNVVNYTVIVDAQNEDNLLLPGMTATVDFLVEERTDVLLVPNAAMAFQATPAMQAKFREQMKKRMESLPDSVKARFRGQGGRGGGVGGMGQGAGGPGGGAIGQGGALPEGMVRVWYIGDNGEPAATIFKKGASDGKVTEIERSRDLKQGVKVIIGYAESNKQEAKQAQPGPQMRFRMF
jgi:HlyD family secretion protein